MNNPIFPKLIEIYSKHGYKIRTGLNPHFFDYKFAPFTALYKNDKILGTGGGISTQEIYFFECLFSDYHPKNIFCIGNAFGWSTIALALLNPNSKIICIDAGIEGPDNNIGITLTNEIAKSENLNIQVIKGFSPKDITSIIYSHFNIDNIDFVFVDGLHTNAQQLLDYNAIIPHCSANAILLFHDVVQYNMISSFNSFQTMKHLRLLHRTDSGMGILYPHNTSEQLIQIINTFSEDPDIVTSFLNKKRPIIKLLTSLHLLPIYNKVVKLSKK